MQKQCRLSGEVDLFFVVCLCYLVMVLRFLPLLFVCSQGTPLWLLAPYSGSALRFPGLLGAVGARTTPGTRRLVMSNFDIGYQPGTGEKISRAQRRNERGRKRQDKKGTNRSILLYCSYSSYNYNIPHVKFGTAPPRGPPCGVLGER